MQLPFLNHLINRSAAARVTSLGNIRHVFSLGFQIWALAEPLFHPLPQKLFNGDPLKPTALRLAE
jgi:hypothetical protein